jgi:protein TonB
MAGSRTLWAVYGVSLLIHLALGAALGTVKVAKVEEAVVITMTEIQKPEEEKEPEPEAKPVEAPKPSARPKSAPVPQASLPQAAPAPDFGFMLSSGGGAGGIAVGGMAAAANPTPVRQAAKRVLSAPSAAPEGGSCEEAEVKAKPISTVQPAYTDEANTARIEGKVRVAITIDPSGAVVDAKVVEGLGHGLDEKAIEALRAWKFSPATRCGNAVASTMTVGVRFSL